MPEHVYIEMTNKEVEQLPRENTVFFSSISPLETHGPHLPIGTDIFIAENLRDRMAKTILGKRPNINAVYLPTLPLGADAIPPAGSFQLEASAIETTLLGWGNTLRTLGFKYWVLTDNHGGPHHQLAISAASRKLARKGFYLIAPFNYVFRQMVALHPEMRAATGLDAGNCGDVTDSHAGTNETSLMRRIHPEKVRDIWQKLGPGKSSPMKTLHQMLFRLSRMCDSIGLKEAATDFFFLGHGLAWVSDPTMESWQGAPSVSDPGNGEKMLAYHADCGVRLLEAALDGTFVEIHPLGWSIRAIRKLV